MKTLVSQFIAVIAAILAGFVFVMPVAVPVHGVDITWYDGTGFWDETGKWFPAQLPGVGDNVTLNVAADLYTITHRSGNDTIRTITNDEIVVVNGGSSLTILLGGTNTRTLQTGGASAGTLNLNGGTLTNTGGTLVADADGVINLSGTTILNGTLLTSGTGVITTPSGGASQNTATLNGVTIASGSTFVGAPNSLTTLVGTITNNGTLALAASVAGSAGFYLSGTVTLAGSGAVTLGNSSGNYIGGSGASQLINAAGHTIQGSGNIGLDQAIITNAGLIVANQPTLLEINPRSGTTVLTNTGTLRATNSATLQLTGPGNFDNAGGTIEAQNGSTVQLVSGPVIIGGTLLTSGTGVITTPSGGASQNTATLNGVTIATGSTFVGAPNSLTTLVGTITNNGTLALASTGQAADLYVFQEVTLTGSGVMTLSNSSGNRITGSAASSRLINAAGHTIEGAGQIGLNATAITNEGLIVANQPTGIVIDPSGNGLTNTGTLRVNAGSTLRVTDNLTNFSGTTLTGGTYNVYGTAGSPGTMRLANANIVTNAATILLDGPNSNLLRDDGVTNALAGFATNAAAGHFTIQNGRNFDTAGNFSNAGIVTIGNASTFTVHGTPTNSGELQLRGGTFAAFQGLTNSGNANGFGIVQPLISNTGSVIANGGTLTANTGISGTTGTVQTNAGGTLAISLSSTAGTLINNGALSLGTNSFTVHSDYQNANFGTGNSFNARASVSGTGQIIGNNASQTITGDVAAAGANTWTMNLGNMRGGTSQTLSYQIANNGTGASIRGAIQTGAPGIGNITDSRLSGTGVTDGIFGPIAAGGNSGNLGVTFNATSAGSLAGQSIAVVSNFSNLPTQIINLSGTTSALAVGNATPSTPQNLGNFHVGTAPAAINFNVTNTTPSSTYAERLGIASATTTGNFSATNNLGSGLIVGGATSNNAVGVQVSGGVAGVNSGNLAIQYLTNGTNIDPSFVSQNANLQNISVQATGYDLAQATLGNLNFGNILVGSGSVQQALSVSNAAGPYREGLNASFGTITNNGAGTYTTNGASITNLVAGSSDNTTMVVTLNPTTAGNIDGTFQILLASNGASTSGLGITNLTPGTVLASGTISGVAGNLAQAGPHTPEPVNLGNVRLGAVAPSQTLSIANVAADPAEGLNASISTASTGLTASGSFTGLVAGTTNSTSLTVGMTNMNTAGSRNGTATITLASDGAYNSGVATPLGTQTVNVTGGVYQVAQPMLASDTIVLANRHVGDAATQALSITNTSAAPAGYQEGLNASFSGTSTGNVTATGSVALLGQGATNNTSLIVGIDTSSAGAKSGTAALALQSDGSGTSGLGTLNLTNQTVNVSGNVYRLASAVINNAGSFGFGNVHVGDTVQQALSITNNVANDGYSEKLNASFGSTTDGRITTSGSINQLGANVIDASSMVLGVNTSAAGVVNGTATVNFASDGTGTSGLGITSLPSQNVTVTANIQADVYRYANPVIQTGQPIDFGNIRIGTAVTSQVLSIKNDVPNDGFSEKLNASANGTTGGVTASGSFNLLAPQGVNSTDILVGLNTSVAGNRSGVATINFASDGTGTSGLGITSLPSQDVQVTGNVYRLANPQLNTTSVNLVARVGDTAPSANISITNTSPDIYTEGLNVTRGATAAGFASSGSISILAAGATSTSAVQVALSTATAGTFAGGTQALDFVSTGAGTTGAPDVSVGSGSVNLNGKVYTPAKANVNTSSIDFGIVHVGDVVTAKNVAVTNSAAVTALNDVLVGSINAGPSPFSASGNLPTAGLGAGQTNNTSLNVALGTGTAGNFTGQASVALASHNADMADLPLGTSSIDLIAQVNNYANPVFDKLSGDGSFSQLGATFTLDFGTLLLNSGLESAALQVLNNVAAPADWLNGSFDLTGVSVFDLSGFSSFSNIAAGSAFAGLSVGFNPTQLGDFSDTVTLHPTSGNTSGYDGALSDIHLVLQGHVTGQVSVPEPSALLLVVVGLMGIRLMRKKFRG